MITVGHLGLLQKISDSLSRDVSSNVGNMSKQLLDEINIVKEGTTAGVCMVVVRKRRPVANEILAPHSKLLTTADTLPKDGSSIISGPSPSSARGIGRKESIKVI